MDLASLAETAPTVAWNIFIYLMYIISVAFVLSATIRATQFAWPLVIGIPFSIWLINHGHENGAIILAVATLLSPMYTMTFMKQFIL